MSSMNKALIIGNVGKDPEVRTNQAGRRIGSFTIATSESWTDKASGERKEQTEWHRIVIFNERLVDIAEKYIRKGSKVCVEGKIVTRKWTDQAGVEKYTTEIVIGQFRGEIVLLGDGNRGAGDDRGAASGGAPRSSTGQAKPSDARKTQTTWETPGADLDDEIPF
jgi:single-strand DNA-binding protein